MNTEIKKVVIAGGGTAGWMAAATVSKLLGKVVDVKLIESDEIGTVGVGEATIPPLITFHRLLDISEQEFMAATQATFKLGISFENWRDVNEDYIHSFGVTGRDHWSAGFQHFWLKDRDRGSKVPFGDYCLELIAAQENKFAHLPKLGLNYAFHLDATLYAKFLMQFSEGLGCKRIEGKIVSVNTNAENGFIESLSLDNGDKIEGDLFIDCTGFRGLLIEQTFHTGYEDWSHWLPCDSAVAIQTSAVRQPIPYTRSIAHPWGWQWRIPLQHRVGNGLVYCSRYLGDEDAKQNLAENIEGEPLTEPRVIKFRPGQRRKHWNKNCVALGLASGFIEPLESTSIHLIQNGIIRLIKLFPFREIDQAAVDQYNEDVKTEIEFIRDFIILHYHLTQRGDSPYWEDCRNMQVPDTLLHKVGLFASSGLIAQHPYDLFADQSWAAVMLGQGLVPGGYHPVVEMAGDDELRQFLARIRASVRQIVDLQPMHREFVAGYCSAPPSD